MRSRGGAFFLLLSWGLAAPLFAAGPGTSAAPFLRLGFGARALGMGEAFVATADDVSALYYNPAGLMARRAPGEVDLLASYALHFQDINISQLGFVQRHWGLAVTYLSVPGLERRTEETAQPDGTFGASDMAFSVSTARPLGPVAVGGTLRVIRQTIGAYSASGLAADLGGLYRLPGTGFSVGASVANIGGALKFVDQGYPLPTTLRLGAAWQGFAGIPAQLGAQVDLPRDSAPLYRAGLEYVGFGPFALRAGYMAAPSVQRAALMGAAIGGAPQGLTEFFGAFIGFGLRFGRGSLDYSMLPYGELGNSHRFSLGLRF